MQCQRTIEGVRLRRSLRSTKNYEWCGVIDGEGVRFIPTVGWRSKKPMYWLPCNRDGRALDPGFHGRGFTTLKAAVQKAKEAIEKGAWCPGDKLGGVCPGIESGVNSDCPKWKEGETDEST